MTTNAGRFKSTISRGSHRRSIVLLRPMATPSAVPRAIATTKDAATRASVAARLTNSAPDRASAAMTAITASGAGSVPVEAMLDPKCHTRTSNSSGANRNNVASVLLPGRQLDTVFIVSLLVEFLGWAGKVWAADPGKDAVKRARVGCFLRDGAARDPIYIGLPEEGEFRLSGDPDPPRDLLPIRAGMGENVLGLGRD